MKKHSIATSDGIAFADWKRVHKAAVAHANAVLTNDDRYHETTLEMHRALDWLEAKYGALPSILATRADYTSDAAAKLGLLTLAYREARRLGDHENMVLISQSLAEHYTENQLDRRRAGYWLGQHRRILASRTSDQIKQIIHGMRHTKPSFQLIGSGNSLHLGFGDLSFDHLNGRLITRAEWEIGSYSKLWIIRIDGHTVCEGRGRDMHEEMLDRVRGLPWMPATGVQALSMTKVQFEFGDRIRVTFGQEPGDDDEVCHMFYPPKMVAVFQPGKGWRWGDATKPWS